MSVQRTPEWFSARLGNLTASRVGEIIPGKRGGYLQSRENLMYELLAERITGERVEKYVSAAMEWGILQEQFARSAYEVSRVVTVHECGYIPHPRIPRFGASPDGLIGPDGVFETKAPTTYHVLKILATGEIDAGWLYQCQTQIACSGRDYCDFVLWDPRIPEPLNMSVTRLKRDNLVIELLETEARKFLAELHDLEAKIRERLDR